MQTTSVDFETYIGAKSIEAQSKPGLVRAMIELTYGCNLRCQHCYNPTHEAKGELSTEQVKKVIDGLAQEGCLWLGFTGGELFLRADVFELLEYARSKGFILSIVTNATLITPEKAKRIKALNPFMVDVSLYGATAETYEAVTGVKGSFRLFERGLQSLRDEQIPLMLKLVLMTVNFHERAAMRKYAVDRQCAWMSSTDIHPRMDGVKDPLKVRLSAEESFEVYREEWHIRPSALQSPGICGNPGALLDCLCGHSSAAVTPYGRLNFCVSLPRPQVNLAEVSFSHGWQTLVREASRIRNEKPSTEYECMGCPLTLECTRGTNDSVLEMGTYDGSCIPHYRHVAKMKSAFIKGEQHVRNKANV